MEQRIEMVESTPIVKRRNEKKNKRKKVVILLLQRFPSPFFLDLPVIKPPGNWILVGKTGIVDGMKTEDTDMRGRG